MVTKKMAMSDKYNAIICLGAVIRGATPHFEYISAEVTKGIASIALDAGIPVIYGVLTTDSVDQAIERAGTKNRNRGGMPPCRRLRWLIFTKCLFNLRRG